MFYHLVVIYMMFLLLRPQEFLPALQSVPLLQFLLLGCLTLWLTSKEKVVHLPQFKLALWFLIAALLSRGIAGWWGGIVPALGYLAPILMLFIFITAASRPLNSLQRIMKVMIACACVMVLHGMWQLESGLGWTNLPLLEGRITYAGIFSDPNDLGQLFVMCIAFCIYLFGIAGKLGKIVYSVSVAWLCYGIYMTDSRGALLAGLVVFGLEGLRRVGTVVSGVLAAIVLPVMIAVTRFGQISSGEKSAQDRIESWYAGVQMFLTHPIFGVGMGNYTNYHILTAHNTLVLPIAELGLLGFIPWFGMLWISGRMLYWLVFSEYKPLSTVVTSGNLIADERAASRALASMAIGFVVTSFFLSQSYKHVLFITVGLIMGRYLNAVQVFADVPRFPLSKELPWIVFFALVAIFGMWALMRILL